MHSWSQGKWKLSRGERNDIGVGMQNLGKETGGKARKGECREAEIRQGLERKPSSGADFILGLGRRPRLEVWQVGCGKDESGDRMQKGKLKGTGLKGCADKERQ